jgi:hypothetical protein
MSRTVAWGNPIDRTPPKKRKKQKPVSKKSKKSKKHSSNPIAKASKHVSGVALDALSIALGRTVVSAIAQNVIPSSWRVGILGNAARGVLALGLGYAARMSKATSRFATALEVGGLSGAISDTVDPIVLPKVAFNLLGEQRYFGELDSRVLTLAGVQPNQISIAPTSARPALQGPETRVMVRSPLRVPA